MIYAEVVKKQRSCLWTEK